jgi:phage terminase small subunit
VLYKSEAITKMKNPPDNTGKKYITKITPKQEKFIDIYVTGYGELTATECAIRAGYEKSSAHTRAHELLDYKQYPEVVKLIETKLIGQKEVWLVDKEMHLANLTRIGNEARKKGLYGVAGKMEELKGRCQGFYIDRNISLTKEISEDELDEKIRRMFPDRDEFLHSNNQLADKIFGKQTTADIEREFKENKEGEERLGQLEKYQEDRAKTRNKYIKSDEES